jgi:hypothetical protein
VVHEDEVTRQVKAGVVKVVPIRNLKRVTGCSIPSGELKLKVSGDSYILSGHGEISRSKSDIAKCAC